MATPKAGNGSVTHTVALDQIDVRKGQVTEKIGRDVFRQRFTARFYHPAFRVEDEAIDRLEAIAWDAYLEGRKLPIIEKAGPRFADPEYELSWTGARQAPNCCGAGAAARSEGAVACRHRHRFVAQRSHVSGRNVEVVPACEASGGYLRSASIEVDVLDLSRLNSEHDLHIHPC